MSTRRKLGLAALSLLVLVGWAFFVEPQRLQVRTVHVPIPGLRRPLRAVLVSDVDFPSSERRESRVARAAAAFHADLVLVAGDLLDRHLNVRDPQTVVRAGRWAASLGPHVFVAPGEEESPARSTLARWWEPLGVSVLANEVRSLQLGGQSVDLFVADHWLDAPPWGLAREEGRGIAVQAGRAVHGFLVHGERRDWVGTETTLSFRIDGPETYLDLYLGWTAGQREGWRSSIKAGRYEEQPAFRLAAGTDVRQGHGRTPTPFVPRPGRWTRVRLRLEPVADGARFSVRFWEEGRPEPAAWAGRLRVRLTEGRFPGSLAIGGRRGGRAIADLRVTDLAGRILLEEGFDDAAGFRARWTDTSVLGRWQHTRDPSRPALLLAHHPDAVLDALRAGGALPGLIVAGHTHGGQIRLPFLGAPFTSTHLGRKYDRGLFDFRGIPLYITAGVGTSIVPARFLDPPEVVLLHLDPM